MARLLVARANASDVEGIRNGPLCEPEAVLACGGECFAVGTDAIYRFYTELLATRVKFNAGNQRPAIICGDLALTSTRLPNSSVTAEIARKQANGGWLWVIDQPSIGS